MDSKDFLVVFYRERRKDKNTNILYYKDLRFFILYERIKQLLNSVVILSISIQENKSNFYNNKIIKLHTFILRENQFYLKFSLLETRNNKTLNF
jgi:hypothetical protein